MQEQLAQVPAGICWGGCWFLHLVEPVPAAGPCWNGIIQPPPSPWRYARSCADGDMQKRERNKLELGCDQPRIWRSFMWMFLPLEDLMGHLHPYIITSFSQASLPGEIKSSMPCSRDIMNSPCQENKPPVSRREDTIKKTTRISFPNKVKGGQFTVGIYPSRDWEEKTLLPWNGLWISPVLWAPTLAQL